MKTNKLLISLLLILCTQYAYSQIIDTVKQPKIGLVLSGGGAKGFAHLGVLKVLDELGIQPDYITGTSMGAIIGGLYSLGYSADDIYKISLQADWNKLLSDNISLNKIVMEEKYESKRYFFNFPIRHWKFKLPSGLVEGQQIEALFKELSWPLSKMHTFDSLPIPFHCMGVDLFSGSIVEIKSGDFTESIRGSMAIPSIFSPESIDSMLIVDGGVGRNFPVEEVKRMGADIVIGVYVGFADKVSKDDLFSLSDVLTRATVLSGIVDSRKQIKKLDIYIKPNTKGLKAGDFNKTKKFAEYGEQAARQHYHELKKLADSLKRKPYAKKKIYQPDSIQINDIHVDGVKFLSPDFVRQYSGIHRGMYVNKHDLTKAVESIYGTLNFTKVSYILSSYDSTLYSLTFKVKEKTRATFQFAAHYENNRGFGFRNNLSLRNILIPGSKTLFALNISKNPALKFEFNKYIEQKQRLIAYTFFNMERDKLKLYVNGYEYGNYHQLHTELGLGVKYSIGLNNQFKCFVQHEAKKITINDQTRLLFDLQNINYHKIKLWSLNFTYRINTCDDLYFPTRGINFFAHYRRVGNVLHKSKFKKNIAENNIFADFKNDNFQTLYIDFSWHTSFLRIVSTSLGFTLGLHSQNVGFWEDYGIGGIAWSNSHETTPFSGLSFGEVFDSNFALAKLVVDVKLYRKIYLSGMANVGYTLENIDEMLPFIENNNFQSYLQGYALGLKFDMPFGPVKMMFGDNNSDNTMRWYLSVGFPL